MHFPTLEPKAKKRLYFDSHDQKDLKMEENGDLEGAHDDDDNDDDDNDDDDNDDDDDDDEMFDDAREVTLAGEECKRQGS